MKQNNEDSEDDQETIVQDLYTMPSPMLSPPISSSSECETDDEPISPPQHIELDELFDWDVEDSTKKIGLRENRNKNKKFIYTNNNYNRNKVIKNN
ncbi:unnamed protein product [Cunninghamella blakesleeana]